MKYDYAVTHNGIFYAPNTEIPETDVISKEEIKEEVKEVAPIVEEKIAFGYSKTDINRMPINDLKHVAKENGIKNVNTKSGAELKKELIEMFGL